MDITKFNEKYNRVEGNIYTVEEVVEPVDGVYEAELIHDNVEENTINVYTGSKLTGDKINTYTISTPSLTPWKTLIQIFSNISPLYITYETTGDTVEAEDINNLQDSVNETQEELNAEIDRAIDRENTIENNLNKEIDRAKTSENTITTNLNSEITRATNAENTLTDNLSSEINRAKAKESQIDNELANRYTKDKVYTKEEVIARIEALINNAPDVLDTFKEIADALGNDPNFATTMTTLLSQKVDKVTGKGLSTNDFTDDYKNQLIDSNNKKHTHDNKSIIDTITSTLISNWNSAFTHISDTIKHITSAERTLWNTVSNKAEQNHTHDDIYYTETEIDSKISTLNTSINGKANSSHTHTKNQITDMPTKLSQFTNDEGFLKQADIDISQNHTHSNKEVLDKITQNSLDNWNSAYNDINNISIGGRNFALNSDKEKIITTPTNGFNQYDYSTTTPSKGVSNGIKTTYTLSVWLEENKNYSLPFASIVVGKNDRDIWGIRVYPNNCKIVNIDNNTKLYTSTFVVDGTKGHYIQTFIKFICENDSGSTIKKLKLEQGNIPTDWSPAPEDVESSINDKVSKGTTWNELEGI